MENGGSERGLEAAMPVVEKGWRHDHILRHEDSQITSDGVGLGEELDDTFVGDEIFLDKSTATVKGRQKKMISMRQSSYCRSPGRSEYVFGSERCTF